MTDRGLSRRRFTQSLGIVVASFVLAPCEGFGQTPGALPFSVRNNRRLEGWIRLEPDETVTVFTGKAELGQGILTALAQIAADARVDRAARVAKGQRGAAIDVLRAGVGWLYKEL